jgi:hypothetical protein
MRKTLAEVRIRFLEAEVSDNPTIEELWKVFHDIYQSQGLKADFITITDKDGELTEDLHSEWDDDWSGLNKSATAVYTD